MSLVKGLMGHIVVTAVAGATALSLWTKEEEPVKTLTAEVRVWQGAPDQIESVSFESKDLKVRLEPKQDELGRWFVVHVNKVEKKARPPRNPHDPNPPEPEPEESTPGKWVRSSFVSVKEGNALATSLAPLMALRAIGRVDKGRLEEFGFDKPEGTVSVKLGGTVHKLTVGGLTPGGGDRYVQLVGTGEAYAVPGDALRGLLQPESRLLETELHGFDMNDVRRVKITHGTQERELVRLENKPEAWAAPDHPQEQDETASNWMTKVSRLRVSKYLEKEPKHLTPEALVVRIEYLNAKKTLGFVELFKSPGASGDKAKDDYVVRTENTRWYGEVLASRAEQVEQDLASVLGKPGK